MSVSKAMKVTQAELGASGLQTFGNGDIFNTTDYVPELTGSNLIQVYTEMRNDPQIDASLRRLMLPLMSSKAFIPPARDRNGKVVDKGEEIAEFCEDAILRRDLTGTSHDDAWTDFMHHVLLFVPFGFSAFEKVMGVDAKGRQIFAKLAPRLPLSVTRFHIDESRNLEWMEQRAQVPGKGYSLVQIPADRLLLFVLAREGDNYFGRAILRSCYRPWFCKVELLGIDNMRMERHGLGVGQMKETDDSVTDASKTAGVKMVKELRAHERAYFYVPFGLDLKVDYPTGSPPNVIESVKYHDEQIARALMAEVMALGSNVSGSRNLGDTKTNFMLMAIQSVATLISNTINRQVIVPLVDMNYGPQEFYPTLEFEPLDTMTGPALAGAIKPFFDAGVLTGDDKTEEWLRSIFHMPASDPETKRELPQKGGPPGPGGPESEAGPKGEPPGTKKKPDEPKTASEVPPYLARAPRENEKSVDWKAAADFFQSASRAVEESLRPVREKQIKLIASRMARASREVLLERKMTRPFQGTIETILYRALKESFEKGKTAVFSEYRRSRSMRVMAIEDRHQSETVITAGIEKLFYATAKELAWVRGVAERYAVTATDDMIRLAANTAYSAVMNGDISEADIEEIIVETLMGVSEPVIAAQVEGTLAGALTAGRSAAIQWFEERDQISSLFYSAIMDKNTCVVCADYEEQFGETPFGPDDEVPEIPNPLCESTASGYNLCRCALIAVFKDGGEEEVMATERAILAYAPDQERVPAGGPGGGQFAGPGAGGAGYAPVPRDASGRLTKEPRWSRDHAEKSYADPKRKDYYDAYIADVNAWREQSVRDVEAKLDPDDIVDMKIGAGFQAEKGPFGSYSPETGEVTINPKAFDVGEIPKEFGHEIGPLGLEGVVAHEIFHAQDDLATAAYAVTHDGTYHEGSKRFGPEIIGPLKEASSVIEKYYQFDPSTGYDMNKTIMELGEAESPAFNSERFRGEFQDQYTERTNRGSYADPRRPTRDEFSPNKVWVDTIASRNRWLNEGMADTARAKAEGWYDKVDERWRRAYEDHVKAATIVYKGTGWRSSYVARFRAKDWLPDNVKYMTEGQGSVIVAETYFDKDWRVVTPDKAIAKKVIYANGGRAFFHVTPATVVTAYAPDQERDEAGKWTATGAIVGPALRIEGKVYSDPERKAQIHAQLYSLVGRAVLDGSTEELEHGWINDKGEFVSDREQEAKDYKDEHRLDPLTLYAPDQERAPAGGPGGGQWTSGAGSAGAASAPVGEQGKLFDTKPFQQTVKESFSAAKEKAATLLQFGYSEESEGFSGNSETAISVVQSIFSAAEEAPLRDEFEMMKCSTAGYAELTVIRETLERGPDEDSDKYNSALASVHMFATMKELGIPDIDIVTVAGSSSLWHKSQHASGLEWAAAEKLTGIELENSVRTQSNVDAARSALEARPEVLEAFEARMLFVQDYVRENVYGTGGEIEVYRGVGVNQASGYSVGDEVEIETYTLSSWTTESDMAENFKGDGGGMVVEGTVRVDEVWNHDHLSSLAFDYTEDRQELVVFDADGTRGSKVIEKDDEEGGEDE